MLSWLIVLCLLLIVLCPAALPRVGMAAVSVRAARSARRVVTYPAVPTSAPSCAKTPACLKTRINTIMAMWWDTPNATGRD